MGAKGSQGIQIRRSSSVAGTPATLSTNTISFNGTGNEIGRQAGFADFSEGMRVVISASVNSGVFTIKTTDATHVHLLEALTDMASGADQTVSLTGYAMQQIGQITNFSGPAMQAAVIDVTCLQSTAKEKLISIYDSGQVSLSVLYDHDASGLCLHDALERDMQARTWRQFDIQLVGASTAQTQSIFFGGYISGINLSGAVDNALKADFTVALASGVNFTTNTATA